MHVGAVEQRIALGDDGDHAARFEMGRDFRGGAIVEVGDRVAIGGAAGRQFGGDRIESGSSMTPRAQMLRHDRARVAGIAGLGEMRDHVGFAERAHAFSVNSSGSPGPNADADRSSVLMPALPKCATTSDSPSTRIAFSVSSSGSPGPTPTPISRPALISLLSPAR